MSNSKQTKRIRKWRVKTAAVWNKYISKKKVFAAILEYGSLILERDYYA